MNTTSEILENYNGCKCSGGGGGECDFSTCTVTVSCTYEGVGQAHLSTFFYLDDSDLMSYSGVGFYDDDEDKDPQTINNVLLHNGVADVELRAGSYVSSTGAVTYDPETLFFTITGDCTITVALVD